LKTLLIILVTRNTRKQAQWLTAHTL
jgi:hypothetical protein